MRTIWVKFQISMDTLGSGLLRVGIGDPTTLLNQSITSTIMWSVPSCFFFLLRLTQAIKILHSLFFSENTQIEILPKINCSRIN